MKTFADRLTEELDRIKQLMNELLDKSRIKIRRDDPYSGVVVIAPSKYWDSSTNEEQTIQIKLKKEYSQWIESFKLFTENSPEASKIRLMKLINSLLIGLRKSAYGIPATIPEAKAVFEKKISLFYETLNLYSKAGGKELIIIPDTNALIQEPEPKKYAQLINSDKLTIIFLPTVLSELDELKIKSSNSDFREKVKSIIKRLKGYRNQGNLIDGVTVERSITIRMIGSEPNFTKTLSWLDSNNHDDRIIASALEIQRDNPSSTVYLATSDINLQNKVEMARLSYIDID